MVDCKNTLLKVKLSTPSVTAEIQSEDDFPREAACPRSGALLVSEDMPHTA